MKSSIDLVNDRSELNPHESVWNREVWGHNLIGQTLSDQLSPGVTLLAFLRHAGCIFSREMVTDLHAAATQTRDYPEILFFHQGSLEDGEAFFSRVWPEARAVADSGLIFYRAFEIDQGSLRQLLGVRSLACSLRALAKGHTQGKAVGDLRIMPGLFAVRRSGDEIPAVIWRHHFRHAGDHPNFGDLVGLVRPQMTGSPLSPAALGRAGA
ncbi:MAG: hypothetical protein AAGC55_14180 [Myxococcota bacterium]